MKCVEIIVLRSNPHQFHRGVLNNLKDIINQYRQNDFLDYRVYRRVGLNTDLSIHLYWDPPNEKIRKSDLGVYLAQVLNPIGLVYHALWVEAE